MDKVGGKTSAKEQLHSAKKELESIIKSSHCNPILVRLAWHDSGTYDKVSYAFDQSSIFHSASDKPCHIDALTISVRVGY